MIDQLEAQQIAQLTQQLKRLSKQVRLNQAVALTALTLMLFLLGIGQKGNAPSKLVTQELSMVDEEGREWAVFGLDGHRRRGLHLFGGGIGDLKSSPDRSEPLLSLVGNYISVIDPRDHAGLSLNPTRVELRTGDARAEMSVYHEPLQISIDTPSPRRAVVAGLVLSAGDAHAVRIFGANTSSPAVSIASTESPAIVVETQIPSPPGAVRRVWSAPPSSEAGDAR